MAEAQRPFRRVVGYRQMPVLVAAVRRHAGIPVTPPGYDQRAAEQQVATAEVNKERDILVTDEETGLLVPPGMRRACCSPSLPILSDPQSGRRHGTGRTRRVTFFTVRLSVDRLERVYSKNALSTDRAKQR